MNAILEGDGIDFGLIGLESEDICPASFEAAESHVKWMAAAWGVEPSPIRYAIYESKDAGCWICPESAACGIDGRVGSTEIPHRHELSHAGRGPNCSSSFIEEGWATLYSDAYENTETVGTLRDAMVGIQETGRVQGIHYALAQRVVAFLLETRGLETLHRMCTKPLGNEADLKAALLDVLGLSIDEFQAELDAYPPWSRAQLRQDQACEGADAVVSQASWTIDLGCSHNGVEGRLGGEVSNHVLVEVAEPGHYTFDFNTSEPLQNLWVELRGCERDGLASIYYATWIGSSGEDNHLAQVFDDLTPGVYVLRVRVKDSSSLGPDIQIALSVTQWP